MFNTIFYRKSNVKFRFSDFHFRISDLLFGISDFNFRIFQFVLLTSYLVLVSSYAKSQTGYTGVGLLAGVSTNNNTFGTLVIEKETEKKLNVASSLELSNYFFNSSADSMGSYDTYVAAGLLVSAKISYSRNYSARFFVGAMAGTDNKYFILYPVAGFRQNINLAPNFSLLFQERAAYIFYLPKFNWQATFQIGGRLIF